MRLTKTICRLMIDKLILVYQWQNSILNSNDGKGISNDAKWYLIDFYGKWAWFLIYSIKLFWEEIIMYEYSLILFCLPVNAIKRRPKAIFWCHVPMVSVEERQVVETWERCFYYWQETNENRFKNNLVYWLAYV